MLLTVACLLLLLPSLHAAEALPRVDLHAHVDDETNPTRNLQPADAVAVSKKLRVRMGILGEGGCAGEIRDDRTLAAFLQSLAGLPVWRGLQVYGFGWRQCLSPENLDQLDYLAADALVFPYRNGKAIWLWLPGVKFDNVEDFMNEYVAFNERVIGQRIDVWANPTYLPESLQSQYDALWTPARMDRLISAAVRNHVAIEINAHFQIPSRAFIRRAKRAGARFSFGSNRHVQGIGEIDYCLRTARDCGLRASDIWVPSRVLPE